MKQLILTTTSSLLICLFAVTSYPINLINSVSNSILDSPNTGLLTTENPAEISTIADFKTPQDAVKAFIVAWRKKSRAGMLKVAEKDVVDGIGKLVKGTTFRGCEVNTESAQKAYICTVQAGNDDLAAIFLEVVLTRIGYRIMSIDYAAH